MTTSVDIGLTQEEFAQKVVDAAASQMLTQLTYDPDDGTEYRTGSFLAREIESAVLGVIREQARSLVPQIAEAVLAEGVTPTDSYGYAKGGKRPLGTVIAEEISAALNGRGSGFSQKNLLQQLIHDEVDRKLKGELSSALEEAKRVVIGAVSDQAVEALRGALVKSLPGVTFP